jgi:hypothetical protein
MRLRPELGQDRFYLKDKIVFVPILVVGIASLPVNYRKSAPEIDWRGRVFVSSETMLQRR